MLQLFHRPGFLILWATGALYGTMRWLEILVVALYTFDQTGSPIAVAGIMFVRMLPMVLFGSFVGAIADRLDCKRLLLTGFSVLGVTAVVLALLASTEALPLWVLAVSVFVGGTVFSADLTIRRMLLGEAAGMPMLGRALALDSATSNATRMLGPLLGGAIYQALGLPGVYALAALIYISMILLFSRLANPSRRVEGPSQSFLASMSDALRYVRGQPRIMAILSITMIINIWAFPVSSMVPVIGRETLGLSASWIGFLASGEGAGSFAGAVLLSWFVHARFYIRVYVSGSILFLACVTAFSLMPGLWSSWPTLVAGGMGVAGFAAMQPTLIMAFTDPAYRSRVMGLLTVCIGTGPIGILHLGFMAEWLGPTRAVTVMGFEGLAMIALVIALFPTLRQKGLQS
jgi:MFS family permease